MTHVHKRLTTEAVIDIFKRYEEGKLDRELAQAQLGVKRRRFFELLKKYREEGDAFEIAYTRVSTKRLSEKAESAIEAELTEEKRIVEDPDLPVRWYNYSAVQTTLKEKHSVTVSVPTIISRAKEMDCYIPKKQRGKVHDREVSTNYVGELVQHDSSLHLWSPYAKKKWYLITSIDDYSRLLLYAQLVETETSWKHISAVESVVLRHGFPHAYYVDQHSIFRYVKSRDTQSPHVQYRTFTDDVDTQWKHVMSECGIDVIYALSPQAKGKVERPYRWLQDRIVRTCAKDGIAHFAAVQDVLRQEVERYNTQQVHTTTQEIPIIRFEQAVREQRSLFRPFALPPRYTDTKDLFALRNERIVNNYKNISVYGMKLSVSNVTPGKTVDVRLYPYSEKQLVEVRILFEDRLVESHTVKIQNFNGVHF